MSRVIRGIKTITIKEIGAYAMSGIIAVVVDYIFYLILSDALGLVMSKIVSYMIGATVGFVLNKFFSFHSRGFHISEILKYAVLYSFSAVINSLINRGLLSLEYASLISFIVATGSTTLVNFLGQKFVVFRNSAVHMGA